MYELLLLISWNIQRRVILYKVHIEEMKSLLQPFNIRIFQIYFRILHNFGGLFKTVSNIYDEAFFQK